MANTITGFNPKPDLNQGVINKGISTNVPEDVYRDFVKVCKKADCTKGHYLRELILFVVKRAKDRKEI